MPDKLKSKSLKFEVPKVSESPPWPPARRAYASESAYRSYLDLTYEPLQT
jgi:hypothetical protein